MFWYKKIRSQFNKSSILFAADNSELAHIVFPTQKTIPANTILKITVHIWVRKGMLPHSQASSIFSETLCPRNKCH